MLLETLACVATVVATPQGTRKVVEVPAAEDGTIEGVVVGPDGEPWQSWVRFVWDESGQLESVQRRTDHEGRFSLPVGAPGRVGALLVDAFGDRWRPTALEPVSSGTRGVRIELGEPRWFEVDVRDSRGVMAAWVGARLSWRLAGHAFTRIGDSKNGERPRFELPDVPFEVAVWARGCEGATLGPLDPAAIGDRLCVELEARPRLRGRVVHDGVPVAAQIESTVLEDEYRALDRERPPYPRFLGRRFGATRSDGTFEIPVERGGTWKLQAWHDEFGSGSLGPFEVDPVDGADGLVLALTEPPSAIEGTVLLPPGHDPDEIWLVTARGYARLRPDGTFRLPDLPSGESFLRFVASADGPDGRRPPFSTGEWLKAQTYFSATHLPTRAPAWLRPEPVSSVTLRPGETSTVEIDLRSSPPCRLGGEIRIGGSVPRIMHWGRFTRLDPPPRILLERAAGEPVSFTDPGDDGRFLVGADRPGTYRLRVELDLVGGGRLVALDRVRLVEGDTPWALSLATGSVRVPEAAVVGGPAAGSPALRWRGPGDLRVFAWAPRFEVSTREWVFPHVPAGPVQLVRDAHGERTTLAELTVTPGEVTVYGGGPR